MFNRFCVFILTILLSLTILSTVFAEHTSNIKDDLDYLTSDELTSLQGRIDEVVSEYGLDIAIVITDDTEGKSSRDYADDYYDYNDFGIDEEYSGLFLLINMDIRDVHISTTGHAIRIFTDYRIESVLDAVAPYLSDGEYYNACNAFIGEVAIYADFGVPTNQHNYDTETGKIDYYDGRPTTYIEKALAMMKTPFVYIIAAAIALLITFSVSKSSRGKDTTSKLTYEEGGSFKITDQKDLYIRQSISRIKINTSSSSSGGGSGRSSTHRSSSGRSHGGGGRKF